MALVRLMMIFGRRITLYVSSDDVDGLLSEIGDIACDYANGNEWLIETAIGKYETVCNCGAENCFDEKQEVLL